MDRRRAYRRRRAVAGLVVLALVAAVLLAVRGESTEAPSDAATGSAEPPPELPGGGRELFPDRRVVAFYGAPQDEALGALGIGKPDRAARRLLEQARPYETRRRPVLPALELVATIAEAGPGEDGLYRTRQRPRVVRRYLAAAREVDGLLLLDIQPGRADFMSEARAYEEFLREPDVGLALDPEWNMGPDGVPGQSIGSVDAAEINRVARYLDRLVEREDLPEKLLLVHQFTEDMITDREELEAPPGVALTLNVDGFGTPELKREKYQDLARQDRGGAGRRGRSRRGAGGSGGRSGGADGGAFPVGFKLFYEEDTNLMSPEQVLGLRPSPDVVIYE